jgi:hypothetical protein
MESSQTAEVGFARNTWVVPAKLELSTCDNSLMVKVILLVGYQTEIKLNYALFFAASIEWFYDAHYF